MIVLGPHATASLEPLDLSEESSSSPELESSQQNVVSDSDAADTDVEMSTPVDDAVLHQWKETRLETSRMLGSIGATPLASSMDDIIGSTSSFYLEAASDLAESHVDLIRTLDSAVKTIRVGTGVRLGLGPVQSANEGVVPRVEKAWVERKLKNDYSSSMHLQHAYPKLALSTSRRILHQIMVDQAISLRGILHSSNQKYANWDEFIDDMRYFSEMDAKQNTPVLTLSKLLVWLNELRIMLSFVMSELLSEKIKSVSDQQKMITLFKQSTQLAKERVQFAESAFDLSPTEKLDSKPKRHARKMVHQLKSSLDAAHVCLQAMCQTFLQEQDQRITSEDKKDAYIWWVEFKRLLSQTEVSVDYFQSTFLAEYIQEKESMRLDETPSSETNTVANTSYSTEHFDDAPIDDIIDGQNSVRDEHVDKTWVFSASGVYRASNARKTERGPHIPAAFDQTMLMRDLQTRLKTMELAKEHDVVKLDDTHNEDKSQSSAKEKHSVPFFLGAGGSLLSELSIALKSDKVQMINKATNDSVK